MPHRLLPTPVVNVSSAPSMSNAPTPQATAYKLRVACDNSKGDMRLALVEISDEGQEFSTDAYTLVIRQNNKTANTVILGLHFDSLNSDKCNRQAIQKSCKTTTTNSHGFV
jgi:hypothetical protein